jgi:hypothetical protein
MLIVDGYLTMRIPAGEAATARMLFSTGKPRPAAEFRTECNPNEIGGEPCVVVFAYYETEDGDYCTKASGR